jgi:hypothetical protein
MPHSEPPGEGLYLQPVARILPGQRGALKACPRHPHAHLKLPCPRSQPTALSEGLPWQAGRRHTTRQGARRSKHSPVQPWQEGQRHVIGQGALKVNKARTHRGKPGHKFDNLLLIEFIPAGREIACGARKAAVGSLCTALHWLCRALCYAATACAGCGDGQPLSSMRHSECRRRVLPAHLRSCQRRARWLRHPSPAAPTGLPPCLPSW